MTERELRGDERLGGVRDIEKNRVGKRKAMVDVFIDGVMYGDKGNDDDDEEDEDTDDDTDKDESSISGSASASDDSDDRHLIFRLLSPQRDFAIGIV